MTDLKSYLDELEKDKSRTKTATEIAGDYFKALKIKTRFQVRKVGKTKGRPSSKELAMEALLNFPSSQ